MKLDVDFSALWLAVRKLGGSSADFTYVSGTHPPLTINTDIFSKDISLEDVKPFNGLLTVNGVQVLLYIQDHSFRVEEVIAGEKKGNRFHVADCQMLKTMRQRKRYDRYVVTNDVTGVFPVSGTSTENRSIHEGVAELHVCKYCLGQLNYKGYKSKKGTIHKEFFLDEFFTRYSTLFATYPKAIADKRGGYVDGWDKLSSTYRERKKFTCESCNVNLSTQKNLLHAHHVNGVKRDNSDENLRALCIDCHRKEPAHGHMQVTSGQVFTINKLRRAQGLFEIGSWDHALKFVDSAYHGLVDYYRKDKKEVPEIGYCILNLKGEAVAKVDIAWPKRKLAIIHDLSTEKAVLGAGWKVKTLDKAMKEYEAKA
jgi:hypothetical protein